MPRERPFRKQIKGAPRASRACTPSSRRPPQTNALTGHELSNTPSPLGSYEPRASPDSQAHDLFFVLAEHQSSIRDIAQRNPSTGVIIAITRREYSAFGVPTSVTPANGANTVDLILGYTGRMWDSDAEIQNNLNRWYDPSVSQWLSEDPIGFEAGDENTRRYVSNDPVNKVDPSGLEEKGLWAALQSSMCPYDMCNKFYNWLGSSDRQLWSKSRAELIEEIDVLPYAETQHQNMDPVDRLLVTGTEGTLRSIYMAGIGLSTFADAEPWKQYDWYLRKKAQNSGYNDPSYAYLGWRAFTDPTDRFADAAVGIDQVEERFIVGDEYYDRLVMDGNGVLQFGAAMAAPTNLLAGKAAPTWMNQPLGNIGRTTFSYGKIGSPYGRQIVPGTGSAPIVQPGANSPVPNPAGYRFQRSGVSYAAEVIKNADGSTSIAHYVTQNGKRQLAGLSEISAEGQLSNAFDVPADLRRMDISRRMYDEAAKVGYKSVEGKYYPGSDNFEQFHKYFDAAAGNAAEAVAKTPAGKVNLENGLSPRNVRVDANGKITVDWVKGE